MLQKVQVRNSNGHQKTILDLVGGILFYKKHTFDQIHKRNDFGKLVKYKFGMVHSDTGPAYDFRDYFHTGAIKAKSIRWRKFGCLHNTNGHASHDIKFSLNSSDLLMNSKIYGVYDYTYRKTGPSEIVEEPKANSYTYRYRFGFMVHRENGPAYVKFSKGGNSITKKYSLFGTELDQEKYFEINRTLKEFERTQDYLGKYNFILREFNVKHSPEFFITEKIGDKIIKTKYFLNKPHADIGPAEIRTFYIDGKKVIDIFYFKFGVRHRDRGPAVLQYVDGTCTLKEYYQFGYLHNENGPARYKKNSIDLSGYNKYTLLDKTTKEYRLFGYLHRLDGPARISLNDKYKNNRANYYEWHQFGNLHRLDGPARIIKTFTKQSIIFQKTSYVFGIKMGPETQSNILKIFNDLIAIGERLPLELKDFGDKNKIFNLILNFGGNLPPKEINYFIEAEKSQEIF